MGDKVQSASEPSLWANAKMNQDDYDDKALTAEERQRLRRLLAADNAWRWFAVAARNIALWVTGIVAAVVAVKHFFDNVPK